EFGLGGGLATGDAGVAGAGADEVDARAFEQGLAGDVVHGAVGAGAGVVGEQDAADGFEDAGGDEHGVFAGAHDAFEVGAEVLEIERGVFAALAEHDEVGLAVVGFDGIGQGAVFLVGDDVGETGLGEVFA